MTPAERLQAALTSHYPGVTIDPFTAGDHACAFTTSQPLRDPDANAFRSAAPVLNELAVAHRLSVAFARGTFGLPLGSGLAIRSLASRWACGNPGPDQYELRLRSSPGQRRGMTELAATLVRRSAQARHDTELVFTVMPASLVRFVRQSRGFADYADAAVDGTGTAEPVGPAGERRYSPAETDRLLDGARTDHVPALVLVDIMVATILHDRPSSGLLVQFARYVDPRIPFLMRPGEADALATLEQDGMIAVSMMSTAEDVGHRLAGNLATASNAIPAAMAPARNTEA